jgi:hypothetical protein
MFHNNRFKTDVVLWFAQLEIQKTTRQEALRDFDFNNHYLKQPLNAKFKFHFCL